jgi:hypothetical protein
MKLTVCTLFALTIYSSVMARDHKEQDISGKIIADSSKADKIDFAELSKQLFVYDKVDTHKRKNITISMGSDMKDDKTFSIEFGMIDLGVNVLHDKTDYTSPAAQAFLKVSPELKNENLFSLRNSKSINVNIYPVLAKWRVVHTEGQRIYLTAGVGLQMYNFRFNKNITYLNKTTPEVISDTILFTKNKLAFTYLSVPLMATFKTKLAPKAWLVYGVGITGGYRIDSWTKQVSGQFGKVKNHDSFNFSDFNSCLTAEIGLDNYFRLYASYQLTALQENALDQHPLCIGLRIGGM